MTEQEYERRSAVLRAQVDAAHAGWLRHPASSERLARYEHALLQYDRDRQRLLHEYFRITPN